MARWGQQSLWKHILNLWIRQVGLGLDLVFKVTIDKVVFEPHLGKNIVRNYRHRNKNTKNVMVDINMCACGIRLITLYLVDLISSLLSLSKDYHYLFLSEPAKHGGSCIIGVQC